MEAIPTQTFISKRHSARQKVVVVGAGFAGLAAAADLAQRGFDVTVLEKNSMPGGRARKFEAEGFTFDMGPSWYWMPDVFEQFFKNFGRKTSDYFHLHRLDPSYQIFFEKNFKLELPASPRDQAAVFEKLEPGSGEKLRQFLDDARFKYEAGMKEFVNLPALSPTEFFKWKIISNSFRLNLFRSHAHHVRQFFKNDKLIRLLEFPVLFLGATPEKTPALYSLMNYADLSLGTWYPMGGMFKIVEALHELATEMGAKFRFGCEVEKIRVESGQAIGVETNAGFFPTDAVLAAADYHHVEQKLLEKPHRSYSEQYWSERVLAPSSLIFYLGVNKKLKGLRHHNLFFDRDFRDHAREIYEAPAWPAEPLFYACAPSITDPSVAPPGCENLFLLVPLAPGLEDTEAQREQIFQKIMTRLELETGQDIRNHLIFKRSYAHRDFENDYHAFRGNAYGLANTLLQTAFLKPKMRSRRVGNLFFAGQLTTPGPGMPPALISGKVAANLIATTISTTKKYNYPQT